MSWAKALLLLVAVIAPAAAQAQETNPSPSIAEPPPRATALPSATDAAASDDARKADLTHQTMLLGDLLGLRPWLDRRGVTLFAGHVGETAWGIDGGQRRGVAYAQQTHVGLIADLDKSLGWHGAKANLVFINRSGDSLSAERTGNLFEVQEIYGGSASFRLLFAYVEQSLADGRVNIAAGRIAESSDFAAAPYYCRFQTVAICGVPNALPVNGSFTFWPFSTWGARVRAMLPGGFRFQSGVYEINPQVYAHDGWNLSTRGATGVSIPVELGWRHGPVILKAGYVYDTSRVADLYLDHDGHPLALTDGSPLLHRGRSSGYATFDYVVQGNPNSGTGTRLFGGVSVAQGDRSFYQDFEFAGVIRTGTFSSRPQDSVSLFWARGNVSGSLGRTQALGAQTARQTDEMVIEADYGIQLTPWLNMMPNVQIVLRPGATGTVPDAVVLGLKTNLTL